MDLKLHQTANTDEELTNKVLDLHKNEELLPNSEVI